jgi:hypothetical protein
VKKRTERRRAYMKKIAALLAILILVAAVPAFAAKTDVSERTDVALDLQFEANEFVPYSGTELGPDQVISSSWTPWTLNDPAKRFKFFKEIESADNTAKPHNRTHVTAVTDDYPGPPSNAAQGIAIGRGIWFYEPMVENYLGVGIYRKVSAIPGRVYLYTGWMDYCGGSSNAYRPLFGINTSGAITPNPHGTVAGDVASGGILGFGADPDLGLLNVGDAKWGFNNNRCFQFYDTTAMSPGDTGGFYSVAAAWPAEANEISLWHATVVRDNGTGHTSTQDYPISTAPVWDGDHMSNDSFALWEFAIADPVGDPDFTNKCYNGTFEGDVHELVNSINGSGYRPAYNDYPKFPNYAIPDGQPLSQYQVRLKGKAKIYTANDTTNKGGNKAWICLDPNGGNDPFAEGVIKLSTTFGAVNGNDVRGRTCPIIIGDKSTNGRLRALWVESAKGSFGKEDVVLKYNVKLTPTGSWGTPITVATGLGNKLCGQGNYAMATNDNGTQVHVVYVVNHSEGNDDSKPGLWYRYSADAGTTWQEPKYIGCGAFPQIKVDSNGNAHIVYLRRVDKANPSEYSKWAVRHVVASPSGVLSEPKILGSVDAPYYVEHEARRFERSDYNDLRQSVAPVSFDIDADNKLHVAVAGNDSFNSKNLTWVDYFVSDPSYVPAGANTITMAKNWGADKSLTSGSNPNKPITLTNKVVVAEGYIFLPSEGDQWYVPYIYVADTVPGTSIQTGGIRVVCINNVDEDPDNDVHVGDIVNLQADANPQYSSAVTAYMFNNPNNPRFESDRLWYGELQIGRWQTQGDGSIGIKLSKVVKVGNVLTSETIKMPQPVGIKGMAAAGQLAFGMPAPEDAIGTPACGMYVTYAGTVRRTEPFAANPFFYLDDGSGVLGECDPTDPSVRYAGIKVYSSMVTGALNEGEFKVVKGVVSQELAQIGMDENSNPIYGVIRVIRPSVDDPAYIWTP